MPYIDILRKNFELLKDSYCRKKNADFGENNSSVLRTIAKNIIVPMLEIQFDEGCYMWEYELNRYSDDRFGYPVDYDVFADTMLEFLEYETAAKVFSRNDRITEAVFKNNRYVGYAGHLNSERFVGECLFYKNYDLARKLLGLLMENTCGGNNPQTNLYYALDYAITSSEARWKIDSDGIDFILEWLPLIASKTQKAQLEVGLLSLIDCVEGDAPRGAMPFSMINEEDALQRLAEDKKRIHIHRDNSSDLNLVIQEYRDKKANAIAEKIEEDKISIKTFDDKMLQDAMTELNALVGLKKVKDSVSSLCNLMKVRQIRKSRGLTMPEMSQHLVFTGNPGTGKTTVARIIGKIYYALGFLSKGHFVETDRSGLVAGYVGQTALKTKKVIDDALGGVLFIDEAYSLAPEYKEDYGAEAIETLLKAMEDYRDDFVVIVAGYDSLMPKFIDSNPGLKSRFNKFIYFPDYSGNELLDIFLMQAKKSNYSIDINILPELSDYFMKLYLHRDDNFGNARDVRNIFEKVVTNQADRVVSIQNPSNKDLLEIIRDDFIGILYSSEQSAPIQ